MKTLLEVLQCARKLLDDPKCWIKQEYHIPAEFSAPDRYCIVGAIDHCADHNQCRDNAYNAVGNVLNDSILPQDGLCKRSLSVISYNDRFSTIHSDIIRLLDKTIEKEESK